MYLLHKDPPQTLTRCCGRITNSGRLRGGGGGKVKRYQPERMIRSYTPQLITPQYLTKGGDPGTCDSFSVKLLDTCQEEDRYQGYISPENL